jgi:hypothetical protein
VRREEIERKELRRKGEKKNQELEGKETGGKEKVQYQGTVKKEKELTILPNHLVSARSLQSSLQYLVSGVQICEELRSTCLAQAYEPRSINNMQAFGPPSINHIPGYCMTGLTEYVKLPSTARQTVFNARQGPFTLGSPM